MMSAGYGKLVLCALTAVALTSLLPHFVNCKVAPEQGAVERLSRQATPTEPPDLCTVQANCLPSDVTGAVPSAFVACSPDGQCICSECFIRQSDANKCYICRDFPYNQTGTACGNDARPSQKQAFLYSLFLSSTGAAHFYVGNIALGIGQLVVLILFLLAVYVMICPCCVCCGLCDKEGAIKGTCIFICLFVLAIVVVVVFGLGIVVWWLTDLIRFTSNQVMTPAGCFLKPDF